jgi:hypothetical protein
VAAVITLRAAVVAGAVSLGLAPTANAGITLKTPDAYNTGGNPLALALGDVNGDGHTDIVTADNSGSTATVLLGQGDGTFTVKGSYPSSAPLMSAPGDIVLGHFLGTGHLDAALVQIATPFQVELLPGAGDGSFGAIAAAKPAPSQYAAVEASGVLTSTGKEGIVLPDAQKLDVFLANGNGTFTTEPALSTPGFGPSSIVVADINGDGVSDVITGGAAGLWVFLGKGDGTFQAGQHISTGTLSMNHLKVGDFNGDGHPDLAYLDSSANRVGILLGDGTGSFSLAPNPQPAPAGSQEIAAGDLDSDGHLDVVTTSRNGNVMSIFRGNGDGTLAARQDITVSGPWQPVISDFNGDGNPDIAVGSGTLDQVLVYANTPPTAAANPGTATFGSQTVGTAAPSQAVSLQNTSASSLPYVARPHLALSGANAGDFSVSGCTTPTAPGASCQLTVGFRPTASGARSAKLTIADNAGTQTLALQGTGANPSATTTTTTTTTPPPPANAPTISKLTQTHRRWRETRQKHHKRQVGTAFSFTLSQPATLKLVFQRQGRKPYKATITLSGHTGTNRIKFSGRLGGKKRLPPGTYVVTISAINQSGRVSAAQTLRFTILA